VWEGIKRFSVFTIRALRSQYFESPREKLKNKLENIAYLYCSLLLLKAILVTGLGGQ
jgi:hypothetical protein